MNTKRRPCLLALEPSMGSVYSKSSATSSSKAPNLVPLGLDAMMPRTCSTILLASSLLHSS